MSVTVVQKYGGSSVADVDRLRVVANRVAQRRKSGARVVVVLSAMGRTTDELLELARSVSVEPPRRELDMLLSAGERIASALLAMALSEHGVEAVSFTGSQCGIITNHRHTNAQIVEVRPYRVEDELAAGRVVIIAGYQGVSYKKEVTTLGRGGSDTTAVAMAAALGADVCEIYSDVDGVYSADPSEFESAEHISHIDYETMLDLSHGGARVLNADAVAWAQRHGVRIVARATSGSDRETVVGYPSESPLVSITGRTDVCRVDVSFQSDTLWKVLSELNTQPLALSAQGSDQIVVVDGTVGGKLIDAGFATQSGLALTTIVASNFEVQQCKYIIETCQDQEAVLVALSSHRAVILCAAAEHQSIQSTLHKGLVENLLTNRSPQLGLTVE